MDDFSDDGFDDLNVNVLDELESNAIQFTQAQQATQQEPIYHEVDDDDDFHVTSFTDDLQDKSALLPKQPIAHQTNPSRVVPQQPQQNGWGPVPVATSHYRPHPVGSATRQALQVPVASRSSQFSIRTSQVAPFSQMRPPPAPRPAPPVPSRYQASQAPQHPVSVGTDQSTLEARIQELELKLQTKDGEIDIVRRNLERHKQDHEREVQALKKQTAEQITKSERAVEAAKAAQQTATTELEFTRRDLREEVDRAKRREKDGGTPKKITAAKVWGVSDGFDDIEMAVSPSKGTKNRNARAVASMMPDPPARLMRTPTKNKRKRPNIESPVGELEIDEDVDMLNNEDSMVANAEANAPASAPRNPLGVDYLRVILNHSSAHGRPLTFAYLAGFYLPSKPEESLAATLLHKIAVIGIPEDPMRLPVEFCDSVIELWLQCRKEGCLAPIGELVSMVTFTLQLNTIEIAPYIAEALVSAALDSWYETGIPRLRNQGSAGDPTDANFTHVKDNIPTSPILQVMYLTALGCATSDPVGGSLSSPIMEFWNCVHPDFILMMIKSHKQPVDDFMTTLKMLCTSAFDQSIGPISTAPNRTLDLVAPLMIERLTFHLLETRQWNVDRDKERLICFLLLRTLTAFVRSTFGIKQLAMNEYAIPRLVIFLSRGIDELYDRGSTSRLYMLSDNDSTSSQEQSKAVKSLGLIPDEPGETQSLIAHTMLLLHTIITSDDSKGKVNVPSKLSKITGTQQKYLLSLGRLNFAEEGVSEETAELAHELLEMAVTEEEGAELGEFFGG